MEIKIDCPIQVGDLVWVKPEDSYNFVQSKVTNVEVVVENGYIKRIYYRVEVCGNYDFADDDEGLFLNKEDIFKFYADYLRKDVSQDFGEYVFGNKTEDSVYQILNEAARKLNCCLDKVNDENYRKQIHHTVDVINKEKQGY